MLCFLCVRVCSSFTIPEHACNLSFISKKCSVLN
ncbi:hypothetical protein OIU84_023009 [Salix udensis]|uniref:Uncharacterized protein n=1 Tax=Salix udensis TaxID=889485 RepID=A0AAD6PGF1_9ROSI|nr:hypothetical protein OIU84_023009 [Salix udensis]